MRKVLLQCARGTVLAARLRAAQINLQPCALAALNHAHFGERICMRAGTNVPSFVVNLGAFAVPGSKPAGEYAKIERASERCRRRTRDDEIGLLKAAVLLLTAAL
jgi:hypothetical protein